MIVLGVYVFQSQNLRLGAQSTFSGPVVSTAGFGTTSTVVINSNAQFIGSISSTDINAGTLQVDRGASVLEWSCSTDTYNPPSLASSGNVGLAATNSTSTQLTVTGAAVGDICFAGLDSATNTPSVQEAFGINCLIKAAASGTVTFTNFSSSSIDFATGTLRVCYFGY